MKRSSIPFVSSLLCLISAFPVAASAQTMSFQLDRQGPPLLRYLIRVDETTGRGSYQAQDAPGSQPGASGSASAEVPITVSAVTLKKMFAAAPLVKGNRCETHIKKIAQTGAKTLRYEFNGSSSECHYNYSDEERVNAATTAFEAVGETMQFGDRLSAKLRFDRLGLDVEMDNLQSALSDGRALMVENIAPVLQSIQNDERVMDRVRRKAARVLESAGVLPAQTPAVPASSDR